MRYWREFFQQFRRQYFTTGSILPSSRWLGRALAAEVRAAVPPRRILEVGPGTGAVTAEILKLLQPEDTLDLVEINANFVAVLQQRFRTEPLFQRHAGQVQIIHGPLQEVPGTGVYDFLISGLPLNNFPVPLVEDIFAAYQRLLRPGGSLSYFEYSGIRELKCLFVGRQERRRLRTLGAYLSQCLAAHQYRAETVFWNLPPAVVRHLRFQSSQSEATARDV